MTSPEQVFGEELINHKLWHRTFPAFNPLDYYDNDNNNNNLFI
jgi:hypothetical protein